jgi:hypothetical protein
MLIGLSGHTWMFASLAWIMGLHEAVLQKTCGFADLLYKDFAAGADRLEVHDQPSTPPYRQKGRDRLMTPI